MGLLLYSDITEHFKFGIRNPDFDHNFHDLMIIKGYLNAVKDIKLKNKNGRKYLFQYEMLWNPSKPDTSQKNRRLKDGVYCPGIVFNGWYISINLKYLISQWHAIKLKLKMFISSSSACYKSVDLLSYLQNYKLYQVSLVDQIACNTKWRITP